MILSGYIELTNLDPIARVLQPHTLIYNWQVINKAWYKVCFRFSKIQSFNKEQKLINQVINTKQLICHKIPYSYKTQCAIKRINLKILVWHYMTIIEESLCHKTTFWIRTLEMGLKTMKIYLKILVWHYMTIIEESLCHKTTFRIKTLEMGLKTMKIYLKILVWHYMTIIEESLCHKTTFRIRTLEMWLKTMKIYLKILVWHYMTIIEEPMRHKTTFRIRTIILYLW